MGNPLQGINLNDLSKSVKSAKLKKAQGVADAISTGGVIASSVISTIYTIKNEGLRNRLAENFEQLEEKQKIDLENKINSAKDTNQRIQILINTITNSLLEKKINKERKSINVETLSKVQKERLLIFSIFGISILAIVTFLIIKKRSKNVK
jgi:hypothetical protein